MSFSRYSSRHLSFRPHQAIGTGLSLTDILRRCVFSTRERQRTVIHTVIPEHLALHSAANANGAQVERPDETSRSDFACYGPDGMVIYLVAAIADIDLHCSIQIILPTMI